jgi:sugar phosphate permease
MTSSIPRQPAATTSTFALVKWSIFAVLILSYILVYFHRMAPGVVAEDLMAAFETTGSKLGTLAALYFIVYACMQIPSGIIADTLGTRISVIGGNAVAGLGSLCFGLADSFAMACLGRFLVGLGVSVIFVSIMKSNSLWFPERVFGLMSGLTLLIGNLGSVLAAGPLAGLLAFFSWRAIFIGIGLLSLALAALSLLVVRNKPQDLGFASLNASGAAIANLQQRWWQNLLSVLAVRRIWPGFWVQFGMIGGLYSFMGLWGVPYLRDVFAAERSFAADHMTVMLLAFAFGALFFGWFSDRLGQRKSPLLFCVVLYVAVWLVLVYLPWQPGLMGMVLFASMGFAGSGFVLTFAAAKELIDPRLAGMAVSVVNTGCFIGTALMQPLFGYLADLFWDGRMVNNIRVYAAEDYQRGFYLMLFFAAIAVIGALCLKETGCRNISGER